jgi:hypothetical protein
LREERRVLKAQLRNQRVRLSEEQRRRLAGGGGAYLASTLRTS